MSIHRVSAAHMLSLAAARVTLVYLLVPGSRCSGSWPSWGLSGGQITTNWWSVCNGFAAGIALLIPARHYPHHQGELAGERKLRRLCAGEAKDCAVPIVSLATALSRTLSASRECRAGSARPLEREPIPLLLIDAAGQR